MKKLLLFLLLLPLFSLGQTTELFISEYNEGSGLNKAIEIYNGTGADVDLSTYALRLYTNGSSTVSATLALSGTILNGSTYVVINNGATDPTLIAASDFMNATVINFNGDDVVELTNAGIAIDVVGTIGIDPGVSWAVAGDALGTQNRTMIRKASVCSPTTDWLTAAGTNSSDAEWVLMPVDDFSNLGSHTEFCNPASCPSPNAPTTGGDVTICSGTSATLTATTALAGTQIEWYDSPAGGTLLFTGGSFTTATLTSNTTFYAEEIAPGCTPTGNRSAVNVTISTGPIVDAGTDITVCAGTSITLSGSGALTYTWDNGVTDGVAFAATTTTTYTVTGTDAGGCTATDIVTVTVNNAPVVNAGLDLTICSGTNITLSGSGAVSYTWDNGVTNGVAFMPGGTTTYTVTGTDATGCSATDAITVTVNASPIVSAGTDQAVCDGGSITLSGSGAVSYTWDNGVTDGVAFTPTASGTYTVTGTGGNGCTASDDVIVTVNPLPAVNGGGDVSVCAGTSITLSGSGAATYVWDNGVTDGVAFTPVANTTYRVDGTDANGCTAFDLVNVTIAANITVSAGADMNSCVGSTITLSGSSAAAGVTYVWDNGVTDGVAFTQGLGTTIYTVIGTDGNGCQGTDQISVTVNSLPTVNAGTDQTVCAGAPVTLSGSGALTYTWDNGVTDGVSFAAAATTNYMLTGIDANGCSASDVVTVTVNSLPAVNAGTDMNSCTGASVTLSASGALTYVWDNGVTDGVAFTPTATTTYTVNGTDANGCIGTDAITITVQSLPTVNAGTDMTVCEGTAVSLTGSGASTYSWDNGVTDGVAFTALSTTTYTLTGTDANGCSNTDQVTITVNAAPAVDAGADQFICVGQSITLSATGAIGYVWDNSVIDGVSFTPAGTQTYMVSGTDALGCSADDFVTVTVYDLPIVDAGADQAICAGQTAVISGTGAANYTWDNGVSDGVPFGPSTTMTYTVIGTDLNGCSNTDQVIVTVNTLPAVDAGTDQSICAGAQATLSGSGATTYTWDNSVTDGVAFAPSSTSTYTVTGTDANGCSATDQVVVSVNALPIVDAGADQEVCIGGSVTLTGSGASTLSWDGGISDGVAFTPSASFNYTLTGTDANGCSATDNVFVMVHPLPVVNAGADQTICAGESVSLTATGGVSYSWTGGISNGVAFAPSSTQTYTVTATDIQGCSATDDVTVTVNALPSVSLTGSNPSNCGASDGSVSVSGNGSGVVSWSGNASGNSGNVNLPFTISLLGAGGYSVYFTDANGCVSPTVATSLSDPGAPATPIITATGTSFCSGSGVTLTSSATTDIVWSNGETSATIVVTTPGTYSVTASAGNCNSVSAPVVITEIQNPVIIQSASTQPSNCGVADGTITIGGLGTGNISWSGTASGSANSITLPFVITGLASGSYDINFSNGCPSNTVSSSISDPGITAPIVTASGATTFCDGGSVTLTSDVTSGITWSNGSTSASITVSTTGNYFVNVTSGACSAVSGTVAVLVNPIPTVNVDPLAGICTYDAAVALTATPAGGSFSGTGVSGSSFDPSGLAAGTYTISYNVTVNGCSNSASTDIVVDSCLSVSNNELTSIGIYPVPASNKLHVKGESLSKFTNVVVIDQSGRELLRGIQLTEPVSEIDLTQLNSGIYFLVLQSNEYQKTLRFEVMK